MNRLTIIDTTITQAKTSMPMLAGLTSRGARTASGASIEFFRSSPKLVSHARSVTRRHVHPHARPRSLRYFAETAESDEDHEERDDAQHGHRPFMSRVITSSARSMSASSLCAPTLNRTRGASPRWSESQ